MKTKLFYRLCLILVIGLTIVSCSNDEVDTVNSQNPVEKDESGMYHYQLDLNCDVPTYDEGVTTRSVVYTWDNAATIIVRFKSGSKYIDGLATYSSSDNLWTIGTYDALPMITGEGVCELYYFYGAAGMKDTNVTMTENTACYYTTNATYLHPSETSITINASLGRKTWRLRFKGTSGTKISLPGANTEIKYCSAFNGQTGKFTDSQKDIELTVGNNGYTPYIYGTFINSSGDNTITVVNGNSGFAKKLSSTNLGIGESAYLTIPTDNSHSGWEVLPPPDDNTIDPNATIQADNMVTFTDGIVMSWKLGNTATTFDYTVFTKSGAEGLTDDQLASEIYTSNPNTLEYADYLFKSTNSEWFTANTEYYLCAVAKNSSGKRGPVLRQLFKTNSDNLPSAEISNIKASSTTKWTYNISLKNNAKSYYLATSTDEDDYNSDWHWYAYYVYRWGATGQLEAHDWTSVTSTLNSGTCNLITVCTWGLDANKNIGNPNVAFGSASSSAAARSLSPVNNSPQKGKISQKQMQKIQNNTIIYRISE